jgi:hypothetical protein
MLGLAEIEAPYAADEEIAKGEIEKPPQHIDGRG